MPRGNVEVEVVEHLVLAALVVEAEVFYVYHSVYLLLTGKYVSVLL